jgi:hypothetical protein
MTTMRDIRGAGGGGKGGGGQLDDRRLSRLSGRADLDDLDIVSTDN